MPDAANHVPEPVRPNVSVLAGFLRAAGFSLGLALADLVDAGMARGAGRIWIDLDFQNQEPFILVLDDGYGYDAQELVEAMRLGNSGCRAGNERPLKHHALGLKLASLSQCQQVTVASRRDGRTAIRRWDLDYVVEDAGDWRLLATADRDAIELVNRINPFRQGTLVLWQKLDPEVWGIQDIARMDPQSIQHCSQYLQTYLGMVFQRFLTGSSPALTLSLKVCGHDIKIAAVDPFMSDHPATRHGPRQRLKTDKGSSQVQYFILPHKDLLTEQEYLAHAGPNGWIAQQGCYLYVGGRLLLMANWLGLEPGFSLSKQDRHQLARMRIDIDKEAEVEWNINLRKGTASPPPAQREQLRDLVHQAQEQASHAFVYRGMHSPSDTDATITRAWVHTASGSGFQINRRHPVVSTLKALFNEYAPFMEIMLRMIEETVPAQQIWLQAVRKGEIPHGAYVDASAAELERAIRLAYTCLTFGLGFERESAISRLLKLEPFNRYPDDVHRICGSMA